VGWMSSPSSTPSPSPTITPTLFHPFSSLILLNAATRFGGEEFVRLPAKKNESVAKLAGDQIHLGHHGLQSWEGTCAMGPIRSLHIWANTVLAALTILCVRELDF